MHYDHLGRLRVGASAKAIGLFILGALIVIGLLVLIFGSMASNLSGRTQSLAQAEADKFLRGVDAKAMCVGIDSDGDGYVSCPYVTKDGTTHPLECAGSMTINSGCRPPKAVFTQPQTAPR